MTLPARQQRTLDQIEATLQSADPRLRSMYATFTRLTSREAMPATESLYERLPRPVVLVSVMVVALMSAVLVGLLSGTSGCAAGAGARPAWHAAGTAAACRTATTSGR